jgi:hypothetical protein
MPLPVSDTATVTMSMHDYRKIERDREALEERIQELEAAGSAAQPEPADIERWRRALQMAAPIVQYAVGNLNPESHRDWPAGELWALGELLPELFPNDADVQSLAITFRQFAAEAEDYDDFREHRRQVAATVVAGTEAQDNTTKPDVSP